MIWKFIISSTLLVLDLAFGEFFIILVLCPVKTTKPYIYLVNFRVQPLRRNDFKWI